MKVKIEVTAEDIEMGVRYECRGCPIARAVMRRFPEAEAVFAREYHITIFQPYGLASNIRFGTPNVAVNFMNVFDYGKPVQPITFEMVEAA